MTEKEEAVVLANRVLDKPYIDPDGDICLLARQFLRALEGGTWMQSLREHWLNSIECLHIIRSDVAHCACGWKCTIQPTVGAAVERWIEHVRDSANSKQDGGPGPARGSASTTET